MSEPIDWVPINKLTKQVNKAFKDFSEVLSKIMTSLLPLLRELDPETMLKQEPMGIRVKASWIMRDDKSIGVLDAIQIARDSE